MNNGVYSVSELNTYIKNILEYDEKLRFIKLEGELLNVKLYSSSHLYFSLTDSKSIISGVMFHQEVKNLTFKPKDGDKVFIFGSISLYLKGGRYQIVANQMMLDGEGDRLLKLQQLKKKLELEGLFEASRKREIVTYPKSIGLITASNSAACADLVTNIYRRFPPVNIYIYNALVQGKEAPSSLMNALTKAYKDKLDTIIIARGGGANEDLDAFNDEALVRLVASSPTPIIAAIGHEIDYTLVDFASDKRVSTPTAAAELATPNKYELFEYFDSVRTLLYKNTLNKLNVFKDKLSYIKMLPFFTNPKLMYSLTINQIDNLNQRLSISIKNVLALKTGDLRHLSQKLLAVNPKNVLKRGFSLIRGKNGKIITKTTDVNINDEVEMVVVDGIIKSKITKKENNQK